MCLVSKAPDNFCFRRLGGTFRPFLSLMLSPNHFQILNPTLISLSFPTSHYEYIPSPRLIIMSTPLSINPPSLFSPSPLFSLSNPISHTFILHSQVPPQPLTRLSPLRSHQPTYPLPTKSQFLHPKRSYYYNKLARRSSAAANNMTITSNMTTTDLRLQERDYLLLDSEVNSARPRRIALFVEPSPFA